MICSDHPEILNEINMLREKISGFETVTIINGVERKVHITDIVKEIYNDVEVLRDLNRMHTLFKKYKIYLVSGIIILLLLGANFTEIFTKLIK